MRRTPIADSPEPTLRDVFDAVHGLAKQTDEHFIAVNQRLDAVDKRFDTVDARLDGIDKRLDRLTTRVEALEKQRS